MLGRIWHDRIGDQSDSELWRLFEMVDQTEGGVVMLLSPRKLSLRSIMVLIVVIAVAVAGWRLPIIWRLLDEKNNGPFVPRLQYVWFWTGLILAWWLFRTPSRRLIAYGWVIFITSFIPLPFPCTQVAHYPDEPMYFGRGLLMAMLLLWIAGGLLGWVTA